MTLTPKREELLELADAIERSNGLLCMNDNIPKVSQLGIKKTAQVIAALRLAAKPAGNGVRQVDETELSAVIYDNVVELTASDAHSAARLILSKFKVTTGEPKP